VRGTLERIWYRQQPGPAAWLLSPLAALFFLLAGLRRLAYRRGWLRRTHLPVPVVVVGNLTVGGTGKTPLVAWIADYCRTAGLRPGIVSRGYGSMASAVPRTVRPDDAPVEVGDEPLLLARRTGVPVVVGSDRVAAARFLVAEYGVNLVIADDGLQHYRLGRDVEVVVVDGERRFGNGLYLPAGPLREGKRRLKSVDFIVCNGCGRPGEYWMQLEGGDAAPLGGGERTPLATFAERPVHAVAGIGNPRRFFAMLRRAGLQVIEHPFPDHHPFTAADLAFADGLPVLMTEKDAVKCAGFGGPLWYIPVTAHLPEGFGDRLLEHIERAR
jgi:tetraacyldisaccharide 4'-kinase